MSDESTTTPAEATTQVSTSEASFRQADVDRIVQERIARERAKYEGFDALKAKAAKLDEIEAANATELERAQKRADDAEAKSAKALDAANRQLVRAAVLAEAMQQHAIKPEHLHKLIETDTVTVGDDGGVTGAREAVKAFLDSNPEYVGVGQARSSAGADQGARGRVAGQLTRDALAVMSPEAIVEAQKAGRLDTILKGS